MRLFWSRPATILALIGLAAFVFLRGIVPALSRTRCRFPRLFHRRQDRGERARRRISLYDDSWFQEQIRRYGMESAQNPGKFAPFPPPTALLLVPLAQLRTPRLHCVSLTAVSALGLNLFDISVGENSRVERAGFGPVHSAVRAMQSSMVCGLVNHTFSSHRLHSWLLRYISKADHGWPGVPRSFRADQIFSGDFSRLLRVSEGMAGSAGRRGLPLLACRRCQHRRSGMEDSSDLSMSDIRKPPRGPSQSEGPGRPIQRVVSILRYAVQSIIRARSARNPRPLCRRRCLRSGAWRSEGAIMLAAVATLVKLARALCRDCHCAVVGIFGILALLIAPATATYHCVLLWLPVGLLINYFFSQWARLPAYFILRRVHADRVFSVEAHLSIRRTRWTHGVGISQTFPALGNVHRLALLDCSSRQGESTGG